jgi:hypothetical protein
MFGIPRRIGALYHALSGLHTDDRNVGYGFSVGPVTQAVGLG